MIGGNFATTLEVPTINPKSYSQHQCNRIACSASYKELCAQVNAQLGIHQIERRVDGLVHVVVLVPAQTTGEHHVALLLGELLVLRVQGTSRSV